MATLASHYEGSSYPSAGSDIKAMKKQRTIQTAFGEVPLSWRFWFRRSWIKYWILFVLICVLVILMTVYHHDIVNWLKPFAQELHDLTGGWLIPIGILIVLSIPPLFGHEIVAILCGLVYGLWEGFGIVSAGTLLGEILVFYLFRYFLTERARKMEAKDINFTCMIRMVEKGGFWIVFLARLSAIPGHLTTAVFATTRMGFMTFTLAAILSMPKQLMVVYLGSIFEEEENGTRSTASKIVSDVVLVFSFLVTIGVAVYLYRKMAEIRPQVVAERKMKEQDGLESAEMTPVNSSRGAPLMPFSTKREDRSEERLSLTRHSYEPAGFRGPDMPYGNPRFNYSSASVVSGEEQRWNGSRAPNIVIQSPSDPTLVSRPDPASLAAPPPQFWPVEQSQNATHGQAL